MKNIKNLIITILCCLIPIIGNSQCGKINIEAKDNSLFVYHDSITLDCEAELEFFVEDIGDTIKVYEMNQNVLHDCPGPEYYDPYHNIILEIASFNSGSYVLELLYKFASDVNDTILCKQLNFTIEPGFTSDSIYINDYSIDSITSIDLIDIDGNNTSFIAQNIPNTFTASTEIRYYLPDNAGDATIYIYNMQGSQIASYPINHTGHGSITINGGELNPGMYFYTLIAGDAEVDTKRMILTE